MDDLNDKFATEAMKTAGWGTPVAGALIGSVGGGLLSDLATSDTASREAAFLNDHAAFRNHEIQNPGETPDAAPAMKSRWFDSLVGPNSAVPQIAQSHDATAQSILTNPSVTADDVRAVSESDQRTFNSATQARDNANHSFGRGVGAVAGAGAGLGLNALVNRKPSVVPYA